MDRNLRRGEFRRPRARHFSRAFAEPLPPRDGVHPARLLGRGRGAARRCAAGETSMAGGLVGWAAIVVGLAGVVLHLDSSFFEERTIRGLTYAAPFAAPLAYTGLGLLLLVNRLVEADTL